MRNGQKSACAINAFVHDGAPIIIFGDGAIIWGKNEFEPMENGAIDAAICPLSGALIILGDDGKLRKINSKGIVTNFGGDYGFADILIANQKRGLFCISASRKVFIIKNNGEMLFEFTPPMSPNSVAFDISGNNLAVGHGKGVSLYDLKTNEDAIELPASGGICGLTFSPDLCFLVAATNEPGLIGWRLHDGVAFKMAGYPSKPTGFSWYDNGKKLLTSGGPVGVSWPFIGPNGPMGTNAETFETRRQIVTKVAAAKNLVALGYADGGVDLCDIATQHSVHIGGPEFDPHAEFNPRKGEARISALAISQNGKIGTWGAEDGKWGIWEN